MENVNAEKNEIVSIDKRSLRKYYIAVYIGGILFISAGFLNFIDEFLKGWSQRIPVLGYVLFAFTACSLIPLAIGIRKITSKSFQYQVTKSGKTASLWLILYGIAIIADLIFFGWFIVATVTLLFVLFGRILGFYFLKRIFDKIGFYADFKVRSWPYLAYGIYYLILSLIGGLASLVNDQVVTNLVFIFNGIGESIFIILIGIKIILDFYQLRRFTLTGKIPKRYMQKVRKQIFDEFSDIQEKSIKGELKGDFDLIETYRQRKETKRKLADWIYVVGFCVILAVLIAYAFIIQNPVLGIFSALIFVATLIHYLGTVIIKQMVKKDKLIQANFTDYALLLGLIPFTLFGINFGVLELANVFTVVDLAMKIILIIIGGITSEILFLRELMKSKLNIHNFTFQEFLSFKAPKLRRLSANSKNIRHLKNRSTNFENLDVIAARIEAKQKERSIDIDDFDWKERVSKI